MVEAIKGVSKFNNLFDIGKIKNKLSYSLHEMKVSKIYILEKVISIGRYLCLGFNLIVKGFGPEA